MTRLTMFALPALVLLGSSAAKGAAANQPSTPEIASVLAAAGTKLSTARRADKPSYDHGGWSCPAGFVWRKAGRTDWLCVDGLEAQRIARENARAADTWVAGPDGARTCKPGLVPRDAFKGDPVCVDLLRRASVRAMNMALYIVR